MARKLVFIPAAQPTAFAGKTLTVDDIPADIRADVEEAYTTLKAIPGRIRAEFDNAEEIREFEAMVKAYCEIRPAGKLSYRRSPARNLPDTTIDYRITDFETKAERETRQLREAAERAQRAAEREAAGKGTPGRKAVAKPEAETAKPSPKHGKK